MRRPGGDNPMTATNERASQPYSKGGFAGTSAAHGGNRLPMEQVAPIVGGGALILFGLSRRHPIGLVPALIGGLLIVRGATIRHPGEEENGTGQAARGESSTTITLPLNLN